MTTAKNIQDLLEKWYEKDDVIVWGALELISNDLKQLLLDKKKELQLKLDKEKKEAKELGTYEMRITSYHDEMQQLYNQIKLIDSIWGSELKEGE